MNNTYDLDWNSFINNKLKDEKDKAIKMDRILSAETHLRLEGHPYYSLICNFCERYGLCHDRDRLNVMGVLEIEIQPKRANKKNRKVILCYSPISNNKEIEMPEFAFVLKNKGDKILVESNCKTQEFWNYLKEDLY